ncbi:hypothetical protein QOT17_008557 [Balamuthia mandrillaris]
MAVLPTFSGAFRAWWKFPFSKHSKASPATSTLGLALFFALLRGSSSCPIRTDDASWRRTAQNLFCFPGANTPSSGRTAGNHQLRPVLPILWLTFGACCGTDVCREALNFQTVSVPASAELASEKDMVEDEKERHESTRQNKHSQPEASCNKHKWSLRRDPTAQQETKSAERPWCASSAFTPIQSSCSKCCEENNTTDYVRGSPTPAHKKQQEKFAHDLQTFVWYVCSLSRWFPRSPSHLLRTVEEATIKSSYSSQKVPFSAISRDSYNIQAFRQDGERLEHHHIKECGGAALCPTSSQVANQVVTPAFLEELQALITEARAPHFQMVIATRGENMSV